ncbi:ribose transport system substrate-binding protein [Kitasatospora sp. MMS16-BH015]|uniref:sugar ABC transporter substrate-binding protein n=1 Tax=Kitasatospora sp. MMS16-BH015 TaxID=2018025 RepID=UPI000CA35856|nr:sugar ABC transporter substrate-binding protein [Kitasatospora sp. MMS16-BH015]AUG75064.1 ribose transport system substrate-binding protein [Kitasatospora sp. MMS16-BH015]
MKQTLVPAALALLLGATLTACGQEGGGSSAASGQGGKPTVCLVMKSLGNQYFQTMEKGAQAHAAQRGDLTLTASGIQNETDIDGQISAINKCVTDQAAALVVAPADSRALVAPLARAAKAGIKLVNIDVKLDDGALSSAGLDVPYVGPDNTAGAQQSGEVLAKALGPNGKVVILEGISGAANAQQRKAGFQAAATAGGLTVLDAKSANWETDQAYTVTTNLITAHPDLQGVMASNDDMALGAVKAIAAAKKQGRIRIVSFDNVDAVHPYLADGTVLATVDQYPGKQAGDGIDVAMREIGGEHVTGWVKTDLKVVTKSDLG